MASIRRSSENRSRSRPLEEMGAGEEVIYRSW